MLAEARLHQKIGDDALKLIPFFRRGFYEILVSLFPIIFAMEVCMSTLKEMAHEYKVAAAKLAMAIERHKKEGNLTPDELNSLRAALRDTRATAHLLSGYYDTPRQDDGLTLLGMTARRTRDDH